MSIEISREHSLDPEQIRTRVEQVAEGMKDKLSMDYHWQGDQLNFSRRGAEGHILVEARQIHLKLELGVMFRALEGGIREAVEKKLDQALS